MTLPGPWMLFVIHICVQGSLTAAFAPLYGNDPFPTGVLGLVVGFVSGLPFYLGAIFWRVRR